MLSCKEATRLLSASQDRELTLFERLRLRLHLAMCRGCANFDRQMKFLRKASRQFAARAGRADRNGGGD